MLALALLVATSGLDRDTALVDAPAVPARGTVRVGATASAATSTDADQAGEYIAANVQWAPIDNVSADIGFAAAPGDYGLNGRVRLQLTTQERAGLDLSLGARMKSSGFFVEHPEAELFVAAGHRFGSLALALDAVIGRELSGDGGSDAELKGYAHWMLTDALAVGVDARSRVEIGPSSDGADAQQLASATRFGRNYDVTAGPMVSFLPTPDVELQALAGVSLPAFSSAVSPVAFASATFSF